MHEFELHRPRDLGECLGALAEHGEHASLLAGGTDLNVLLETGLKAPAAVIDLGLLGELRFLREEDGGHLIGATATHADVASHFKDLRCLSLAAGSVGSPQIRNAGTVGGNIANASPSGDIYPPLLALDAVVRLKSSRGEREVALADVPTGPGETLIEPGELMTEVAFAGPPEGAYTDFVKVGLRNALAISVASAAIVARGDGGAITDIRIACGAVAPRPMRMHEVEDLVTGKQPSRELVQEAAKSASALCCPIGDIRGTAEYRRHVTGVIVSRLVENAFSRLAGYRREA
jgi:carbon-monoxide dehydrogenase medium subunit